MAAGSGGRPTAGRGPERGPKPGDGRDDPVRSSAAAGSEADTHDPPVEVLRAYAPYLLIILVFCIAQIGPIKDALQNPTKNLELARPGRRLEHR